jgi:DNA transformation protein
MAPYSDPDSGDEGHEFIAFLLDQLRNWAPVTARRMFGGHGLFCGGVMFAIVSDETLFLRTDGENRPAFEASEMQPFRYLRAGRLVALGYHQAPPDLFDDGDALVQWSAAAYGAALRMSVPERRRRQPDRRRR